MTARQSSNCPDTYNQLLGTNHGAQTEDEGLKDEQIQTMLDAGASCRRATRRSASTPSAGRRLRYKLNFTLDLAPADIKNLTPQEIAVQAIKRIDATLIISKPMVQIWPRNTRSRKLA